MCFPSRRVHLGDVFVGHHRRDQKVGQWIASGVNNARLLTLVTHFSPARTKYPLERCTPVVVGFPQRAFFSSPEQLEPGGTIKRLVRVELLPRSRARAPTSTMPRRKSTKANKSRRARTHAQNSDEVSRFLKKTISIRNNDESVKDE